MRDDPPEHERHDEPLVEAWRHQRMLLREATARAPGRYLDAAEWRLTSTSPASPAEVAWVRHFEDVVAEHVGMLNRWRYGLDGLGAWTCELERHSDERLLGLILEFVDPLAISVFGFAARMKQALIHTACEALADADDEEDANGRAASDVELLRARAGTRLSAHALLRALVVLDSAPSQAATEGFRDRFTHVAAPRQELGMRVAARRIARPRGLAQVPPTPLASLIPRLESEFGNGRVAFERMWELLRELAAERVAG